MMGSVKAQRVGDLAVLARGALVNAAAVAAIATGAEGANGDGHVRRLVGGQRAGMGDAERVAAQAAARGAAAPAVAAHAARAGLRAGTASAWLTGRAANTSWLASTAQSAGAAIRRAERNIVESQGGAHTDERD